MIISIDTPYKYEMPPAEHVVANLGHSRKELAMSMQDNSTPNPSVPQSTIAPSEKHLEDWIVANPKGFGCNWDTDELPEFCYPENPLIVNGNRRVSPFFKALITRQMPLQHGRPDLIMFDIDLISVIELKKGVVNYDVIGQCKRYIYDIEDVYSDVMSDAINNDQMQYVYNPGYRTFYGCRTGEDSEIQGMVIGHTIQDKNIPIVAKACGIRVVTYEYVNEQYVFTEHSEPIHIPSTPEERYPYNKTRLAKAIRLVMLHHSENALRLAGGQL